MTKLRLTTNCAVLCVILLACGTLAHAQATRTWVSGVGDDANPCSRTAPCRTFAGAISKTAEGGEIDALDPSGFGSVQITKAITIDGTTGQGFGGILAAGTFGVRVNIATSGVNHPNDADVTLRNLYINGAIQSTSGGATNGVEILNAAQVHIENCGIQNFGTTGIRVSISNVCFVWVNNTTLSNTNTGISTSASAGGAVVINMDHLHIEGMTDGIVANSLTFGTLRDSYISGMTGLNGALIANANATVNAESNTFVNNSVAVSVNGGTVRIFNNAIYNNTKGLSVAGGGHIASNNSNRSVGNTTSDAPTDSLSFQ